MTAFFIVVIIVLVLYLARLGIKINEQQEEYDKLVVEMELKHYMKVCGEEAEQAIKDFINDRDEFCSSCQELRPASRLDENEICDTCRGE